MKFVMIKEYDHDLSKDKVIVGEIREEYTSKYEDGRTAKGTFTYKVSIAYLLVIADFDQDYDFNIIHNTESVQIRPKAIYKNDKGYYKKVDNKRVFFNEKEVIEIEKAIDLYKEYLKKLLKKR